MDENKNIPEIQPKEKTASSFACHRRQEKLDSLL